MISFNQGSAEAGSWKKCAFFTDMNKDAYINLKHLFNVSNCKVEQVLKEFTSAEVEFKNSIESQQFYKHTGYLIDSIPITNIHILIAKCTGTV